MYVIVAGLSKTGKTTLTEKINREIDGWVALDLSKIDREQLPSKVDALVLLEADLEVLAARSAKLGYKNPIFEDSLLDLRNVVHKYAENVKAALLVLNTTNLNTEDAFYSIEAFLKSQNYDGDLGNPEFRKVPQELQCSVYDASPEMQEKMLISAREVLPDNVRIYWKNYSN